MHKTVPIQVWADVDEGIVETVRHLNTLPGVRTHASCEGTVNDGGSEPYKAHVMASWPPEMLDHLRTKFDIKLEGENWGYLYLK